MSLFSVIQQPTLLVNEAAARRNIARMAAKARSAGIAFRPHFKTHQSAQIGEWFRDEGVQAITVSSLAMAEYFASAGWEDITLAFPVNLRQMEQINRLAAAIRLNLLVESLESARALSAGLLRPVDLWIKIDVGANRTGIPWEAEAQVAMLAKAVNSLPKLRFAGLLTHAGHTYTAGSPEGIRAVYRQSVERMNFLRKRLQVEGLTEARISVGDTPGCTLSEDLGRVDEIRPGNFVFYDACQLQFGVCGAEDIAVALACPIVAVHPERSEVVVYGGAVHLSLNPIAGIQPPAYGLVCLPENSGWGAPLPGASVRGLSQEHGILRVRPEDLPAFPVGGLACILPAHSCLTVSCMRGYLSLDGEPIEAMP